MRGNNELHLLGKFNCVIQPTHTLSDTNMFAVLFIVSDFRLSECECRVPDNDAIPKTITRMIYVGELKYEYVIAVAVLQLLSQFIVRVSVVY